MNSYIKYIILFIAVLTLLPACSANSFWFKDKAKIAQKTEQAGQTVNLALAYHDQGDFKKSSELFLDASDLYREIENDTMESRALTAAAKSQLKCSQIPEFQVSVARLKGLEDSMQMPDKEVQFLVNMSDHMQHRSLSYPVQKPWRIIFGY